MAILDELKAKANGAADQANNIQEAVSMMEFGGGSSGGGAGLEEITYAELKVKRDGGQLTPGGQYRITDYVCTTTQAESQAVSHPFDIIVVADSASVLNENARACLHDGDDYYSAQDHQANLEAWELKYCIDNDDNRFAWADTVNGKGVIYYMKDDRNNECPYDFKQIQFKRYPITECAKVPSLVGKYAAINRSEDITGIDEQNPVWCYTFSVSDQEATSVIYDGTIAPLSDDGLDHGCFVLDNKINPLFDYKDLEEGYGQKVLYLNNIVFTCYFGSSCSINTFGDNCGSNTFGDSCGSNTFGDNCYSNTFGYGCGSNTFGDNCGSNTFGDNCGSNTFGDSCGSNTFGDSCGYNTFGDSCGYNTFGDSCGSNTFGYGCGSNTFGYGCYSNTFGDNFGSNTFGNGCNENTFGNNCGSNTFGDNCASNTFGNSCGSNTFGANCLSNTFGNGCHENTFGNNCYSNTFGANCFSNTFRDDYSFNTFGDNCAFNTFGDNCYSNTFGNSCGSNTFGANCFSNTFGDDCKYVDLAAGLSSANSKRYYHVLDGVHGTQNSHISITGTNGNNFETYVGMNSSGVLKTWVPADLAT